MSIAMTAALFALGLLLMLAEMFVPGGVLGLAGAVCVVVSIVYAFGQSTAMGITMLAAAAVLIPTGFALFVKFAPSMPFLKGMFLTDSQKEATISDGSERELVGKEGTALTDLHPVGQAEVAGRRMDVVTSGELIEKGTRIEVIEATGNRVVVRAKKA